MIPQKMEKHEAPIMIGGAIEPVKYSDIVILNDGRFCII
jgi:hypothetical protein